MFKIMYYLTIACPTLGKTLEMVDKYAEHGVDSFQIDMPSNDPYGETDFVKEMMRGGLNNGCSYDEYMDAIRGIRKKHPDVDISIVVYTDVISTIGIEKYLSFLKEIDAKDNIIAGESESIRKAFEDKGITYITGIPYNDPQYGIEENLHWKDERDHIICMRTRRRTDAVNRNCDAWKDRVKMVRDSGIKCKLYAVADVTSADDVNERKSAGLDGVIIGNCLMRLWNDENALWKLLGEFESFVC